MKPSFTILEKTQRVTTTWLAEMLSAFGKQRLRKTSAT
jgi:hypothetical protein